MRSFLWLHKKIIIALALSILLLSLRAADYVFDRDAGLPAAKQGLLDLSEWDFASSGIVELNGQWAFIPGHLVGSEEWHLYENEQQFVSVPGAWNADLDPAHPTPFGIGTYRLQVLLPDSPVDTDATKIYAFRFKHVRTSYALFINGAEAGGLGVPAVAENGAIAANNIPYIAHAAVHGNTVEIVLQVSNFWRGTGGGITMPIGMGLPTDVQMKDKVNGMFDMIIASIALINLLISASLYLSQRRQSHLLYFSLLHLFGIMYVLVRGERLLLQIFPDIPFGVGFKLLLFCSYVFLFYCYMFIASLYPEFIRSVPHRLMQFAAAAAIVLLCVDTKTLSSADYFRLTLYMIAALYVLYLIVKALFAHREDAPYLLLASTAMFSIGWPDVMLGLNIATNEVPPFDQVVFFISLLLLAARRFVQTFKKVEQLSLQRSRMETALLQAQIKPHFLFNSLNTIGSLIETDPVRAQDLLAEFSTYLRCSFDLTNTSPLIPFEQEWTLVEAYLRLEQARYENDLSVEVDVAAARGIWLPPLTLQPLVENAIRHGLMKRPAGGSLRITAARKAGAVTIEVSDNGVGIPPDLIEVLCTRPMVAESDMKRGGGSGIGLYNIHRRLITSYERQRGLLITSREDEGTTVSFQIPEEPKPDVKMFAG